MSKRPRPVEGLKVRTPSRAIRRRRARMIARERMEQKVEDMRITHNLYEETLLPGYLQGYNDALTDMLTSFPSDPAARFWYSG